MFYIRYKVWLVTAKTKSQRSALLTWENNDDIDFWEPLSPNEKPIRIMVAPKTQESFQKFLGDNQIQNELIIENVETYVS